MKPRNGFLVAFTAVLLALVLAACGGDDNGDTEAAATNGGNGNGEAVAGADETLTVTALITGFQHPYVSAYLDSMRSTADELNVDLTILDGEFDAALQAQQFATAIAEQPDGIIVFPTDPEGIVPQAAQADEAGIPLVFSNAEIAPEGEEYSTAFTGPDNFEQGRVQFDLISEAIGGEGNVAIEELYAGGAANVERLAGFHERLEETGAPIELVASEHHDGDVAMAKDIANVWITRFGTDLDGIIGQDDNGAIGAAQAVNDAGLTGEIHVVGNGAQEDALEMIANGEMYATMQQSPIADGSLPVEVMAAVLRGEDYDEYTYLPIDIVKQDNVDEFEAEW